MGKPKCPTCGRSFVRAATAEGDFFPFCSRRCREVDLGRWLTEEYRVPVETERVIRESDETGARGYFTGEGEEG